MSSHGSLSWCGLVLKLSNRLARTWVCSACRAGEDLAAHGVVIQVVEKHEIVEE